MFQRLSLHFQIIFGFWTSTKCDVGEFKKATYLVVARQCEHIFCLLTSPKRNLDEVEKAMIQVVE